MPSPLRLAPLFLLFVAGCGVVKVSTSPSNAGNASTANTTSASSPSSSSATPASESQTTTGTTTTYSDGSKMTRLGPATNEPEPPRGDSVFKTKGSFAAFKKITFPVAEAACYTIVLRPAPDAKIQVEHLSLGMDYTAKGEFSAALNLEPGEGGTLVARTGCSHKGPSAQLSLDSHKDPQGNFRDDPNGPVGTGSYQVEIFRRIPSAEQAKKERDSLESAKREIAQNRANACPECQQKRQECVAKGEMRGGYGCDFWYEQCLKATRMTPADCAGK